MIRIVSICSILGLMMCGVHAAAEPTDEPVSAPELGYLEPLAGSELEEEVPLGLDTWLRVAGSVLKPRNSGLSYLAAGGGGCVYLTAGSTSSVWNTPVYLPQGATVSFLRLYYDDTSASNMTSWFTIYDLYGNIVQEWGVSSTGSGGNGFQDTAAINHQVNYLANSYVLNWRPNDLGSDMQLCGFRIFYETP